jgi:hypothetical protein
MASVLKKYQTPDNTKAPVASAVPLPAPAAKVEVPKKTDSVKKEEPAKAPATLAKPALS